ncbi:MAG: C45 family peptidase [Anaerolineales bacterium]|nr:C45 family peptidase [Anaerolineales bacterium]
MGFQHGIAVADLRPLIEQAIAPHFQSLEGRPGVDRLFDELHAVLRQIAGSTLEMIRGQAEGLGMEFTMLLKYACSFYLETRTKPTRAPRKTDEECTTWAASNGATLDRAPILVKNRDTYIERIPLQVVATTEPEDGYRYLCSTNAGSPGVPSSGMNETGLCVADTRDGYVDYGPGLPYQSLMMHVLEKHDTVRSALEFLKRAARVGGNNLILADARGDLAVFEAGHTRYGIVEANDQLLVNANHPASAEMRAYTSGVATAALTNSQRRYEATQKELRAQRGQIDVDRVKRMMASHEERMGPLCRHDVPGGIGSKVATISCAIYLPRDRTLIISEGSPCQGKFQTYAL